MTRYQSPSPVAAEVKITHERDSHTASCEDCGRLHPNATRERCRLHVKMTGHTVRYVIDEVTVYTAG